RSPVRETPSRRRAVAHLRGGFQRIRLSGHVDRESSQPPFRGGNNRRCLQPTARRILVGAFAVALSVETFTNGQVVPGHDSAAVYDLGQTADSTRPYFHPLRIPSLRMARTVLAGPDSAR